MTPCVFTHGVSKEAEFVKSKAAESRKPLHESNALGMSPAVIDELAAVWEECRESNWDGFDARPVTQDVLRNTYCFLEAMPFGFPRPSVGAEPDGDLTLEWHRSRRRTLSVSVNPVGELHYSALLGPNRVYGTEAFFGDAPNSILNLIRRVYAE